jgi:hypothetical protein
LAEQKIERQKVALATLAEIFQSEFTKALGRSAADLMPRVVISARNGEPNWDANIGILPPATLAAFLVASGEIKAIYDLDDESHARLRPQNAD